ncbi:putative nitrilase [Phaeosphaeria sp. MPI-PUGE-AT-0046c]|nr:putative nitrilase [Phaeosphaeria sp. MPI-PUGE-AT-0046c]
MNGHVVKIAAVQTAPVAFNLKESLAKVERLTLEAARSGAELVIFPEGFLSAYPWRYAFDATIGAREPRGRQWFSKYYQSSISLSSPEFDQLRAIAETNSTFLYVGIIEKDDSGGATLYCTTVFIGKDGRLLSKHRKLIPTATERLVWGRGAGDGLKVVETDLGKVGGLICWENYMPAARLSLYQQGIEIYIAPNADDLPCWVASMQHIAKEGRCFVISVNQFCRVSDFPNDYPPFSDESHDRQPNGSRWTSNAVLSHGGSCVVGPLGMFVAEPVWDKEEIVYADLNMDELVEARMDFDAVGSYSRPDIFELKVNTNPQVSVSFQST